MPTAFMLAAGPDLTAAPIPWSTGPAPSNRPPSSPGTPPSERRHDAPLPCVWTDHYGIRVQQLGHHAVDDETRLVAGSVESLQFVLAHCRGEQVTGTVSVGLPTSFLRLTASLQAGSPAAAL